MIPRLVTPNKAKRDHITNSQAQDPTQMIPMLTPSILHSREGMHQEKAVTLQLYKAEVKEDAEVEVGEEVIGPIRETLPIIWVLPLEMLLLYNHSKVTSLLVH